MATDNASNESRTIAFLSDFGVWDEWVAVCKAVIWESTPDTKILDLSHSIPDYDIREGALVIRNAAVTLREAVYLGVVDPGVGGDRLPIALQTSDGSNLVGPDNGLLMPAGELLGGITIAVKLNNEAYQRHPVCPTFHARDIFSPAAAALAGGTDINELGEGIPIAELARAPWGAPIYFDRRFEAEVVGVDGFGTIRFNISSELLAQAAPAAESSITAMSEKQLIVRAPLARTFSDVPQGNPLFLLDSAGLLSLAVNQGDADVRYGLFPGQKVMLLLDDEGIGPATAQTNSDEK